MLQPENPLWDGCSRRLKPQRPFKYQTMHFHSVCQGGETWLEPQTKLRLAENPGDPPGVVARFVPLKEFYEMQDDETKARQIPG